MVVTAKGVTQAFTGHALSQAVQFIPYYLDTNPVGVANARRLLAEVIADYNANG